MNVNSIFLYPESLNATAGAYGVVTAELSLANIQKRFTEQYINKAMLIDELQQQLNQAAQTLCELPEDADHTAETITWKTLNNILQQVRAI